MHRLYPHRPGISPTSGTGALITERTSPLGSTRRWALGLPWGRTSTSAATTLATGASAYPERAITVAHDTRARTRDALEMCCWFRRCVAGFFDAGLRRLFRLLRWLVACRERDTHLVQHLLPHLLPPLLPHRASWLLPTIHAHRASRLLPTAAPTHTPLHHPPTLAPPTHPCTIHTPTHPHDPTGTHRAALTARCVAAVPPLGRYMCHAWRVLWDVLDLPGGADAFNCSIF